MTKLTSPYNFVPLNKCVYIPSWYNEVSQDIPFEDGEDGWIEVTWKNVSPLIIKEKADKEDDKCKKSVPVYVEDADGKKRYFIPGTSMKGMLRSTLEILSFGKMEQYDDRFFGHREFDTKLSGGTPYQREMQKVKWGWLRMDDDDNLFLSPCSSEVKLIPISDLKNKYPGYDTNTSQWKRNEFIAKKSGKGMFPEIKRGYRLYCTGKMNGKKHEFLIPIATEKEEELSDEAKKAFLTVHAPTPDFDKFIALLDKGEIIPVSYIKKNEKVIAVGLSKMLRLPYEQSVRTLVEKEQKPVEGKDLCETIFGFIGKTGKDASLRGRVQVSHAFCVDEPDGNELTDSESGVLGEPKPSFYPLYLKQTGTGYKTFNEAEGIAGRKLYRVHAGANVVPLPQGNGNDNTTSYFRPLRIGLTFVMRINLHNMRPVEIGAILSALTLHNTKDAWHNIGSAKSFGYGKLECVKVELKGLKHQEKEEYMRAFEEEMECFTRTELSQKWRETEQANMLVNILSEHSDDDVRMMELKEYGEASKNNNFYQLKETVKEADRKITPLLTPDCEEKLKDEVFRRKNKELYVKAETLKKGGKLEEAKGVYETLIYERSRCNLDTSKEETKKKEIEDEIHRLEEQKAKKQQQIAAAERAKKRDAGLKLDNCNTVKVALDVANRWLKTADKQELSDKEKDDLLLTLTKLKNNNKNRDDKKLWSNPQDKRWENIKALLGNERTKKLLPGND